MSVPGSGTQVTVFSREDRCTMLARTNGTIASGGWFESILESAENGGYAGGGWMRGLHEADEGVEWIRGWYTPDTQAARALLAAALLDQSAA